MFKSSQSNPQKTSRRIARPKSLIALTLCFGLFSSTGITSVAAQSSRSRHFRGFPNSNVPASVNNRRNDRWNNDNWDNRSNNNSISQSNQRLTLSSGTVIPTVFPDGEKIYVTREETLPLTVRVDRDIRNNNGNIVIPAGSQIRGEIRPSDRRGSRFFAQTVVFPNGVERSVNAESNLVTRTEVIERGRDSSSVWKGAVAGAAAATLISGVTGNRVISTEKILGGAGLGALAGLFMRGDRTSVEVISFDARRDLDLRLRSNFTY